MKKLLTASSALLTFFFLQTGVQATTLFVGTPHDNAFLTPLSPRFGTLIDFDDLTPNSQVASNAYALQGVQSITGTTNDPLFAYPYSSQSAPNYLSTADADGIEISFSNLMPNVGIGILESDGVSDTIEALDVNGNLLGSFSVTVPTDGTTAFNGYYVLEDTTADIRSLVVSSSGGQFGVDDLQFGATPEPASVAMAAVGLALLGLAQLRGKRSKRHPASAVFTGLLLSGLMIRPAPMAAQGTGTPATPIQHVVVIFGENISFDHYFGTYPAAVNPPGSPRFTATQGTPTVNGLSGSLLTNNPNLNSANGAGASNPFRLDRSQALTADQNHAYTAEQQAYDHGLLDLFPVKVGSAGAPPKYYPPVVATKGLVMGYYDGNTVTALWNYAQRYALNDSSYTSQFGPSTPGAINLISGQTNGINAIVNAPSSNYVSDGNGGYTLINDLDPIGDACSTSTGTRVSFGGKNIGDLLNQAGVTWGWFEGGFDLTATNPNGTSGCQRSTASPVTKLSTNDYIPHHQPFQYYASTANPAHTRPAGVAEIGHNGAANHQYDINDFYSALRAGNYPSVSFLKAPAFQDGHAGYSNPLDEQQFVVHVLNFLQQQGVWSNTAVVLAYDDSDGWYDHQMPPLVNPSATTADALTGTNSCGSGTTALPGVNPVTTHAQGRCGYGTRVPMMVISPYAKADFVDHTLTDQSSVTRFIEDNWLGGERIGQGSFDSIAGTIENMFDFARTPSGSYVLSETTGEPQ